MNPKSNKNLRLNEILLYTFSVATLGILFSGVIKKIEPNKIKKKKKLNILSYRPKKKKKTKQNKNKQIYEVLEFSSEFSYFKIITI